MADTFGSVEDPGNVTQWGEVDTFNADWEAYQSHFHVMVKLGLDLNWEFSRSIYLLRLVLRQPSIA